MIKDIATLSVYATNYRTPKQERQKLLEYTNLRNIIEDFNTPLQFFSVENQKDYKKFNNINQQDVIGIYKILH